jgi:uncharacterized protein (TIGR02246 family)
VPGIGSTIKLLLRRTLVLPVIKQQKEKHQSIKMLKMNTTLPLSTRLYSAYPITVEAYAQSEDERKVRKVFELLSAAWNKSDAKNFASFFTEDCDYITFRGEHLEGRESNEATHAHLFKTFLKNSTLSGEVKKIKFISKDVAIVQCLGAVKSKWKQGSSKDKINANVLIRENGEWKIRAFHNCKIKKSGVVERVLSFFMK